LTRALCFSEFERDPQSTALGIDVSEKTTFGYPLIFVKTSYMIIPPSKPTRSLINRPTN